MINRRQNRLSVVTAPVLCLLLLVIAQSCKPNATQITKVILAEGMQPIVAPVYVADAKGFFKEQGLDVQLVPFSKGKLCLDAVLGGQAQFGTVAETPLMHVGFQHQPVAILATMETASKNTKGVARKDKGIQKPADLKGHKIGVPVGGNAEYFMDVFLKKNGLSRQDVQVVNLNPPEMIGAIVRGDIDAAFSFEPYVTRSLNQLGDKGIILMDPDLYRETFDIVSMRAWAEKNPVTCEKVLRALIKATQFIKSNRDESVNIVAARIQLDPKELANIWDYYNFDIVLDQSLMDALNAQAKWAIDSKTQSGQAPDYSYLFYAEPLKAVNPGAVSLVLPPQTKAAGAGQ